MKFASMFFKIKSEDMSSSWCANTVKSVELQHFCHDHYYKSEAKAQISIWLYTREYFMI